MNRIVPVLSCLLLLCTGLCRAQDIHFSQYYETAVLRNPALTGIFDEDFRAGVDYRSQWNTLGNPYRTTAASAEARFTINRDATDYVTISAMFFSDKAGRAALQTTGIYPSLNYHKSLTDPHNSYLCAGFTAGYFQRSFDLNKLTFDNQYQGGVFVASAGAGEPLPREVNISQWDLGAGISIASGIGQSNNITYVLGLSGYHLTHPRATFVEETELPGLAPRWNGSIGVHVIFNDTWSLQAHTSYTFQGKYHEAMAGGLLRWTKSDYDNPRGFAISGGAFFRMGDAVVPTVKLEYKHESFGISYDVNTSPLKAATGMRGGLELTAFFSGFLSRYHDSNRNCPRF